MIGGIDTLSFEVRTYRKSQPTSRKHDFESQVQRKRQQPASTHEVFEVVHVVAGSVMTACRVHHAVTRGEQINWWPDTVLANVGL